MKQAQHPHATCAFPPASAQGFNCHPRKEKANICVSIYLEAHTLTPSCAMLRDVFPSAYLSSPKWTAFRAPSA